MLLGLAAALALALAGCGSAPVPARDLPALLHDRDLPQWRAVQVAPGIVELAPDLSGLAVTARAESPALVHAGDAVRTTAFLFETPADAARAVARASEPRYAAFLEHALGGAIVARVSGLGYRLHVTRGSEPGSDTVELFVLRRGRMLAVVELLSGTGFERDARDRLLALVLGRLAEKRP